jgi:sigma-B regulation protein RsbU (phosphoserine phosphatase)
MTEATDIFTNESSPVKPEEVAEIHKKAEVLVVDDSRMMRAGLTRSLKQLGFTNISEAVDGKDAIGKMLEKPFDIMLLDMEMPEMNGMEVLAAMRIEPKIGGVPVIVISGAEQLELAVQCIEAGAEDYLTKPPNLTLLRARVMTSLEKKRLRDLDLLRFAQLQAEKENLERTQRRLTKELDEAARYVRSILPEPVDSPTLIDWHYEPSTELAGDSFGYHWIDDDHLAIYLLDVCGHGVGAALLSVSAINTIRTGGLNGVDFRDPAAVLGGLNTAFPMERNNEMYFTIWYGIYHAPTRTLHHASGGHPPAFLLPVEGGILEVNNPGLIVGFLPDATYETASLFIPPGARLIVICDGTYEVTKPDGTLLDFDEFKEFMALNGAEPDCFVRLLTWLKTFNGPGPLDDDFSLVRIQFP